MNNKTDYHPISCDYYDELTLLSVQKSVVDIVYLDEKGSAQQMTDQIKDLVTKNKEEFLITASGISIRLDKLVSVDGKALSLFC